MNIIMFFININKNFYNYDRKNCFKNCLKKIMTN